jgi:hypothetical protein
MNSNRKFEIVQEKMAAKYLDCGHLTSIDEPIWPEESAIRGEKCRNSRYNIEARCVAAIH